MHKDRKSIATLFSKYFGTPYNEDAKAMTAQARKHLRDKFRHADFGMTGGNFLIAETGQICVVENEGNARQSMTTPRVLGPYAVQWEATDFTDDVLSTVNWAVF